MKFLKVRPADRISAKEALEHPWIKSVDMDLRSFSYQWKLSSRNRREAARREKREKRLTERATTRSNPSDTDRSSLTRDYGAPNKREKSRSVALADPTPTPPRSSDSHRSSLSTSLTPSARDRERTERSTDRYLSSERSSERATELLTERSHSRSSERPKIDRSNIDRDRSKVDRTSSTRVERTDRSTPSLRSTVSSAYRSEQSSPLSRSDVRSTTSSDFQATRKYR